MTVATRATRARAPSTPRTTYSAVRDVPAFSETEEDKQATLYYKITLKEMYIYGLLIEDSDNKRSPQSSRVQCRVLTGHSHSDEGSLGLIQMCSCAGVVSTVLWCHLWNEERGCLKARHQHRV